MAGVREELAAWVDRVDRRLVGEVVAAVSVPAERVRQQLHDSGLACLDPSRSDGPGLAELDGAADHLIQQASLGASALGGFAGLGGAATIAPQAAATAVAIVRLAQRLAVVYGFDPDTDRGRMALWRALAAGLEIDLPKRGATGLRFTELPRVVGPRLPDPNQAGLVLARGLVWRSVRLVGGRLGRLVPVVSSAGSAVRGRRRMREVGDRMKAVLRRLAEAPLPREAGIEDAHEVG